MKTQVGARSGPLVKDHLTPSCLSFAIYVLNGFLEYLGAFGFCDNALCQTSNYKPQVLWTMTEKHQEACTPACARYRRNQRRIFSPFEGQQDNVWVHTTKLPQCLDLCCCFGNDMKSFPARNQCYKRSANKTFFLNHQYPNELPVPKIEHPISLRPRQWSKIAILANLPSRGAPIGLSWHPTLWARHTPLVGH